MTKLHIDTGDSSLEDLKHFLVGARLISYEIPKKQNLSCTWDLRLYFEGSELYLSVASDVDSTGGWQEFGFLKCILKSDIDKEDPKGVFKNVPVEEFNIQGLSLLINTESNVEAECGVIMHSSGGVEIVISTAPSPGAVSVLAPFSSDQFIPEAIIEACEVKRI